MVWCDVWVGSDSFGPYSQAADALPVPHSLLPPDGAGGWWAAAMQGPLAAYNVAHGVLMGGSLAPDSRKTGQARWSMGGEIRGVVLLNLCPPIRRWAPRRTPPPSPPPSTRWLRWVPL